MEPTYASALSSFYNKNYQEAFEIFNALKMSYECGYCCLMVGDLKSAKNFWQKAPDSPAVQWGLNLIALINLNIPSGLSYFQIRNFLERDLNLLIENKFLQYAGNIISATDILTEYNPETPKFIGRTLLLNGYLEDAINFLREAKELNNKDPETHFLLAQYFLKSKQPSAAIKILKASISQIPQYLPTKKLLNRIAN